MRKLSSASCLKFLEIILKSITGTVKMMISNVTERKMLNFLHPGPSCSSLIVAKPMKQANDKLM
jgi:hypothetical protein